MRNQLNTLDYLEKEFLRFVLIKNFPNIIIQNG